MLKSRYLKKSLFAAMLLTLPVACTDDEQALEDPIVSDGKGKAAEVPSAIAKAVEHAKKNLIQIPLKGNSIPHEVHGRFGGEHILLKPAKQGTGIIAGGAVRSLLEVAGTKNVVAKTLGRGNPFNAVRATIQGLSQLRDPRAVRGMRQASVAVDD